MKFNFLLGPFALVILVNACAVQHVDDTGQGHAGAVGNNTGGSTGDGRGNSAGVGNTAGAGNAVGSGNTAGASNDGNGHAGRSPSNGAGDTGGSKGVGAGSGGSKTDGAGNTGTQSDGDGEAAGASGDDEGNAAGANGDGDDNAAGANGDGDGTGNGEAGAGAVANSGGSGGLSGSGGFGGLPSSSGGSGGVSDAAGAGGLPSSSGGSAGVPSSSGGSGGLPSNSGGSAGLPSSSGGSAGLPSSSGGSAGLAGSAGSGGSATVEDGQYLYTTETFGGNGRTCVTCHGAETGTISPDQVQALYSTDPNDPLFRSLDSDDGVSDNYTQLQAHATFRVSIELPPGVTLTSDPSATSVVFRRGVPTTINTPALDTVLMWDGRAASLTDQALGAIQGHAQATVTPTSNQLELIAQFEQTDDFFSSDFLRQYSDGGPAPSWPPGTTDSEQRGRRWFAQDSAAPRFNICGQCHGGPMANTTQSNSGLPAGKRFQTVNVSEFNHLNNPTYQFTFPDPTHPGKTVTVVTPDPGRALVTGDVRDVNFFKIPPLWGVKNTAPYFHDNSVDTLDDLMNHYEQHLATFLPRNATYPAPHVPTTQDKADIVAYLKLL